jgi:hypothetical protein
VGESIDKSIVEQIQQVPEITELAQLIDVPFNRCKIGFLHNAVVLKIVDCEVIRNI